MAWAFCAIVGGGILVGVGVGAAVYWVITREV